MSALSWCSQPLKNIDFKHQKKLQKYICATDKLLSIILTKLPPKPAATTFAMFA
jgi:hypothetical protein